MVAIGQLIEYREGETSNPISFKEALKKVNAWKLKKYTLRIWFHLQQRWDARQLDIPTRNDQIEYAEVHVSIYSERLKEDFRKTYAHNIGDIEST